jgi:DNA-directed RNA polymerase delta subunit
MLGAGLKEGNAPWTDDYYEDFLEVDDNRIGLREFYAVTSVDEIGVPQTFLYLDNGFEVDDDSVIA